ncbi:MAG: alpha-L-fucosidase [Thermoguttaceae bacterium]
MMNLRSRAMLGAWLVLVATASSVSASGATQGPDKAKLQLWRNARFGMFIHWGPVSLKGTEIGWSRGAQIPIEEYDNLYKHFNPVKFDADQWAAVARTAGMKYLVLTTKHHDGFCLWDTKQTDYNIMRSLFGRDVVKELSTACRKQGLAFGTYYSVCDWHHPDFPMGSPGGSARKPHPNLDRYNQYLKNQVAELITNYGPLSTLWFDVPQEFDARRGQDLIAFVRGLQPDILINDRTGAGGDYQTPEQHVGAFNMAQPWETCMTICQQWAWRPGDRMKSLKECLDILARTAGGDGNLLLNVGPQPTGEIEPRQVQRLGEIGAWLDKYGQSIYGTRGGPLKPAKHVVSTRTGKTIYLHILSWPAEALRLPAIPAKIVGSRVLTGGAVVVKQTGEAVEISLPAADRREIDTIVALELDSPAMSIAPLTVGSD